MDWNKTLINSTKDAIKAELDSLASNEGPKQRLAAALGRVNSLEEDESSEGQLRRYIYAVSALVHHARHGGLTASQVGSLVKLAYAILQIQGVQPEGSRLGFLYGDLHLALSNIYRRDGLTWRAAWEQAMAYFLSKREPSGGRAFQALSLASRALRLGDASLAREEFRRAIDLGLDPAPHEIALIGLVRALRLGGAWREATAEASASMATPSLSAGAQRELAWEKLCCAASESGEHNPLALAVRRGDTHYSAVFVLEAYLWAAASSKKSGTKDFPKIGNLHRHKDLAVRELGLFYDFAKQIEQCYDAEIPLQLRLKALGEMLAEAPKLISIDKELLVWAAATRWLVRVNAFRPASLCLLEYRGLCLKLSDGKNSDTLGLLTEVDYRRWLGENDDT